MITPHPMCKLDKEGNDLTITNCPSQLWSTSSLTLILLKSHGIDSECRTIYLSQSSVTKLEMS